MLDHLLDAWRMRRVLLVYGREPAGRYMQSFLSALGARPACLPPDADTARMNHALTQGRVSAVIIPCAIRLPSGDSPCARLAALLTLLDEAREAGVPLVILCVDSDIYRTGMPAWPVHEDAPVGGSTQEGLIQSLMDMAADGVSRGLLGDPVAVLVIRHPPCLGSGHPAVAACSRWCAQLDAGDLLEAAQPDAQGVFYHPLDMCCGALALGARHLLGDRQITGAFNLAADAGNLLANRTAALRFALDSGSRRPLRETHGVLPRAILTDGTHARRLYGIKCRLDAAESLRMLLELHRAAGSAQEADCIRAQTQRYLEKLRASPLPSGGT